MHHACGKIWIAMKSFFGVVALLLVARGDSRRSATPREAQAAAAPLEGWPMVQQRYLRPAGRGVRRTTALARVVASRALASAKGRLLAAGWLPWGSAEALRMSGRSVREGLQACAHPSVFPDRQLAFVPLSVACSAACAALLAVASALRAGELLCRCAVSVAADLAQQASLYAQVSAAISNGRFGRPVPLPEPPLPEADPQVYQWEIEPPAAGASASGQQDGGGQPAGTAPASRDRPLEPESARGHADGDETGGGPGSLGRGDDTVAPQPREPEQPVARGRWRQSFRPMQWLRNRRARGASESGGSDES